MQGPYTKTVGLIVPSSDVNIEATYHRFAPPGIAVATNRIALNRLSVKTLEEMLPQTEQAAEDLCHAEPDILISSSLCGAAYRNSLHYFPCGFGQFVEAVSPQPAGPADTISGRIESPF